MSKFGFAVRKGLGLLGWVAFVAAVFSGGAQADTFTWTNSSGGKWSQASNWQPNQVPGAGDTVLLTTPGVYSVNLDVNVAVSNLTCSVSSGLVTMAVSGQTLNCSVAGQVGAGGLLAVTNASLQGNLTIAAGGTLVFDGSGVGTLELGSLLNEGTVDWRGGDLTGYGALVITNAGLWLAEGDHALEMGSGVGLFYNPGEFRKTAAANGTYISGFRWVNGGLVSALSGFINFSTPYGVTNSLAGSYFATNGASIRFAGGAIAEGGASLTGGGAIQFTGGALTLLTNPVPGLQMVSGTIQLGSGFQAGGSVTNLSLSGVTLGGTNLVAGLLSLTNVTLQGVMTVASGGTLVFDGGGAEFLELSSLVNQGRVDWRNADLLGYSGLTFTNSGLWLADGDHTLEMDNGVGLFYNAGEFRKTAAASGTYVSGCRWVNAGLVSALSGFINFNTPYGVTNALTGDYYATNGASIRFAGGAVAEGGATLTGGGSIQFAGGTLTLLTNPVPGLQMVSGTILLGSSFQAGGAITNLSLTGVTLGGTNLVTGLLSATNTTLQGVMTVASGGTLVLDGGGAEFLELSSLVNQGVVDWRNADLLGYSGLTVTNNGLWLADGDHTLEMDNGVGLFYNVGEFRKTAATSGTYVSGFHWVNEGLVSALSGFINFNTPYGVTNALIGEYSATNGASIRFAGGAIAEGGATLAGGGSVQFTGGTLTLLTNPVPGLQILSGTILLGSGFQSGGAITNLSLNGVTLGGTNLVTGLLSLTNVTLQGVMTVASGGTLVFDGGGAEFLELSSLVNQGVVDWRNADLLGYAGLTVVNNGLWLADGDRTLEMDNGVGFFYNSGEFRKISAASGTYVSGYKWVNEGLVSALSGSINFNTPYGVTNALTAEYYATNGASILFAGGAIEEGGSTLAGGGSIQFTGGALTLLTNPVPGLRMVSGTIELGPGFQSGGAITNLNLNGVTLGGTNLVTGLLSLTNVTLQGAMTVGSGGSLVFDGGGAVYLEVSSLLNQGVVDWRSADLLGFAGLAITNAGLWLAEGDHSLEMDNGVGLFFNAGEFRKTAAASGTYVTGFHWMNEGLVSALSGFINFNTPYGVTNALSGAFYATNGAAVEFGQGAFIEGGAVLTGGGVVELTGGTLVLLTNPVPGLRLVSGTVDLGPGFQAGGVITNLSLSGVTLGGTNLVSGVLALTNVTLQGAMTVASGGTLVFDGNGTEYLQLSSLVNQGTVQWRNANLLGYAGLVITNHGLWLVAADDSLQMDNGAGVFYNFGEIRKTAASGSSFFSEFNLINMGVISSGSGTLQLGNGYTNSQGALRLFGGSIAANNLLTLTGGTLEGEGFVGQASLRGGEIIPGTNGAGQLTFDYDFAFGSNATISFTINGPVAATNYPQVVVMGGVDLGGGVLQIPNAVELQPGTEIVLIRNKGGQPVNGTFQGLPEGKLFAVGNQLFRIHYTGGAGNDVVVIQDDGGVRLSFNSFLSSENVLQFYGWGTNGVTYSVEATTNFMTWETVGQYTSDPSGLFIFAVTNSPGFPYRFFRSSLP